MIDNFHIEVSKDLKIDLIDSDIDIHHPIFFLVLGIENFLLIEIHLLKLKYAFSIIETNIDTNLKEYVTHNKQKINL